MRQATMGRLTGRLLTASLFWAMAVGAQTGCGGGGGGGTDSNANDAGIDAETVSDASVLDDSTVGDDASLLCGNGVVDPLEQCDGAEMGGQTCGDLGLPAGALTCREDCTLDTAGCAVCDDAICSDGETAVSCPEDCGVVNVAAGATHTCAVLADGTVWCWGARDGHRMGGTGDVSEPVMVPGINTAVQVAAGRHHTCVRTALGEILCWGANGYGQVGTASVSYEVYPPVVVGTGLEILVGGDQTCLRTPTVQTLCWGRLYTGATLASAPLELPGGIPLALGRHHLCYYSSFGVRCLGRNDRGQLGTGDYTWRSAATSNAATGSASTVGTGASHSCFSKLSGTDPGLYCWGNNEHGQLGRAPGTDVLTPALIHQVPPQVIDGGLRHTCSMGALPTSRLLCWGFNARGQLGTGTVSASHDFSFVDLVEVAAFDSGDEHVCALLPDQTMRCWGDNLYGQIGNGSPDPAMPVPTSPTRFGPQ